MQSRDFFQVLQTTVIFTTHELVNLIFSESTVYQSVRLAKYCIISPHLEEIFRR